MCPNSKTEVSTFGNSGLKELSGETCSTRLVYKQVRSLWLHGNTSFLIQIAYAITYWYSVIVTVRSIQVF